jgi:hypothetical protein
MLLLRGALGRCSVLMLLTILAALALQTHAVCDRL